MKGFVFSLSHRRRRSYRVHKKRQSVNLSGLPQFFRRYGTVVFFTFMFASGMLMGSLSAAGAEREVLNKLDFLFTTNLSERLNQPAFSTFAASFASGFIFLLYVFLCGLSPWGGALVWVSPAFKGFGTGLSAGYLFITYGFKGVGFYLLVVLGGTFLFSFGLIIECIQAQHLSVKIAKYIFAYKENVQPVTTAVRNYMFRSLYILVLTAVAALADMLLWTVFSGLFF